MLKFKRTELLIINEWIDEKQDQFKKNFNRLEGKIVNCGEKCDLYKIGQTILFENKQPQVIPFEYDGVNYLMMDERSVICEIKK